LLYYIKKAIFIKLFYYISLTTVTDLILAVVELLGRDISRLVVEVREALEPVEP
jgi:hypothetical protein